MRKLIFAAFIPSLLVISAYAWTRYETRAEQGDVTTVPSVDLKRYSGKWYEIARYPNKYEKQCVGNVTAEYTLKENGDVEVLNRCLKKDGSFDEAKGKAKIVDDKTNAKLKVSFFLFFYAPYWIIDLDNNYQYAVVGDPKRKYLWILSRTPKMDDALYQQILRRAEKQGFEPNKLMKTSQEVTRLKGAVLDKQ